MVYSQPDMSFIDSYTNAARYMDEKREKSNKDLIEGTGMLVKGGADAYKWKQRKNIVDKLGNMDSREAEILEELNKLKAERDNEANSNLQMYMNASGWRGVPYKRNEDDFVAPVGIGIYRKEYL